MKSFRLLKASEIECRVGRVKPSGVALLLYKDARCDMALLDETVGAMNWRRRHTRDNANCVVSIYDEEKREWIEKEDTGTESNTDAEKGLASDSFKRACVNWGIGRELYTAPFIWIPATKCNIDGGKCNDKFSVSVIGYNADREIDKLEIVNAATGQTVYKFSGTAKPIAPPDTPKVDTSKMKFICADCGGVIDPHDQTGKEYGYREWEGISVAKYGRTLCLNCMRKESKNAKQS